MKLGLHCIRFPSGRWGFVGSIPTELAFDYESESDLQIALQCGPGFAMKAAARHGRTFRTKTWDSRDAAIEQARQYGHEVAS